MRFLVSCPYGLTGMLNNELKRLDLKGFDIFETWVYVEWEYRDMMKINLWSRMANKVYLETVYGKCEDFDSLFDLVQKEDWSNFIHPGHNIIVSVHTKNSKLQSTRAIQAITNKAIYKQISPDQTWPIDPKNPPINIFVMIIDDEVSIMVDSSGQPLHQRWYRTIRGWAPIKENLAAAMVLLNHWKFNTPLWDPMCGSGTIGIEAAMIARNIAPGLTKTFAFEAWDDVNLKELEEEKDAAIKAQFNRKMYQIYCSDKDPRMLPIAKTNAENAGVADTITFTEHDFLSKEKPYDIKDMTILTNPPYGERLNNSEDLDFLYKELALAIQQAAGGGFITSYKKAKNMIWSNRREKRLFNWSFECMFYSK